jgi:hypothetical protein
VIEREGTDDLDTMQGQGHVALPAAAAVASESTCCATPLQRNNPGLRPRAGSRSGTGRAKVSSRPD